MNLTDVTPEKSEATEDGQLFTDILPNSNLVEALGELQIFKPTPVQFKSIPVALRGADLLVEAQTGSGKTLAFMLPIISKILERPRERGTAALIIAPTRELALQICKVVESLNVGIKPAAVIGGASIGGQVKSLRNDSRVVVGTPGRLLDLIRQREIILRKCRHFVLDEADEMLSMGFYEEVRAILERLPSERQGMFFSATISPRVMMLSRTYLKNPEVIKIETTVETAPDITHLFCRVDGGVAAKAQSLCDIIEARNPNSAIVFCNTKSDTELVEVFMRRRGFSASRINSDLSQKERTKIMNGLRAGEVKYLIATDVAARGIDVAHLDLVVNYSIHDEPETYIHRTGRTGRAGRVGTAITLVSPQDFVIFHRLKNAWRCTMEEMTLPMAKQSVA